MKGTRNIILFLVVVALALASSPLNTVDVNKSEEAMPEKPAYTTTVQAVQPVIIEKYAEVVEESTPVEEPVEEPIEEDVPLYDEAQHEILSIIIYQEAGADKCSDDTRRKVGSVFLNRVASPGFPDTFEEVALEHRQYGTLYITGITWPDRASSEDEAHAVQRAKDIAEELLISGSILPPEVIWQAEFPQGDGTYCHQDDIYFCYSEVSK